MPWNDLNLSAHSFTSNFLFTSSTIYTSFLCVSPSLTCFCSTSFPCAFPWHLKTRDKGWRSCVGWSVRFHPWWFLLSAPSSSCYSCYSLKRTGCTSRLCTGKSSLPLAAAWLFVSKHPRNFAASRLSNCLKKSSQRFWNISSRSHWEIYVIFGFIRITTHK